MTITWQEIAPLRLPILALVAVAIFGFFLVTYSAARLHAAQAARQAASSALDNARQQFQRSGEEKQNILRYKPAYQKLQEEGFVGAERRVAWLEALHDADRSIGLFGVQYQIEAQQAYDGQLSVPGSVNRLRSSQMVLTFGVTHEGDLLRFLDSLKAQKVGLFAIRSCSLVPSGGDAVPEPKRANLSATCDLRWLTIQSTEESR